MFEKNKTKENKGLIEGEKKPNRPPAVLFPLFSVPFFLVESCCVYSPSTLPST